MISSNTQSPTYLSVPLMLDFVCRELRRYAISFDNEQSEELRDNALRRVLLAPIAFDLNDYERQFIESRWHQDLTYAAAFMGIMRAWDPVDDREAVKKIRELASKGELVHRWVSSGKSAKLEICSFSAILWSRGIVDPRLADKPCESDCRAIKVRFDTADMMTRN